jgi:bifunctional non-homologous end joining protein LigD
MPATAERETLTVDGHDVVITTPGRVLWPVTGTTKRHLLEYLLAIAPVLLPHLRDRGLTLRRFPDGVSGKSWYQAQCRGRPPFVRTQDVEGAAGGMLQYCVVEDAAGLAWLANLSNLELHPFLAPASRPMEPAAFVVDLDPGPLSSLLDAARVAMLVLERLDRLSLPGVVKTSGARGIHVFVPLAPGHTFDHTKAAARALARSLERDHPGDVAATLARHERRDRVFVDWLQNDPTRSTVAVYSPRATAVPLVSTPVTPTELEEAVRAGRPAALRFGFRQVLERVDRLGDLFRTAADLRAGVVLPPPEAFE